MKRSRRRGFSLVEAMTVTAIVAIAAAVAIPAFQSSQRESALRSNIRAVGRDISKTRTLAVSGALINSGGIEEITRSAGLRIVSSSSYEVYRTSAPDPLNPVVEEVIKVVQFPPEINLVFGTGGEVRFMADGTRLPTSNDHLELIRPDGRHVRLDIALTGAVRTR